MRLPPIPIGMMDMDREQEFVVVEKESDDVAHRALERVMKGYAQQSQVAKQYVTSGIGRVTASSNSRRRRGVRLESTSATTVAWRTRFTRAAFAVALSLSLFALMGCSAAARRTSMGPVPALDSGKVSDAALAGKDDPSILFNEAIFKSAVVTPDDELPLVPLKPGPDGTFTVTTWAKCRDKWGPNMCGSYEAPGSVTLKWDVWVTGNNEVQNTCRTWTSDLVLKIHQLLGLPPLMLPADTMKRQFVTLTGIPAANIFRPCTDTRVDTDRCVDPTGLPSTLPTNAPPDYYKWFTKQAMSSWQIPARGQEPTGYPWTRLGYTYNWAPGAPSRYGASEYVISGKSQNVTVTVVSVQTAKDFCAPQ